MSRILASRPFYSEDPEINKLVAWIIRNFATKTEDQKTYLRQQIAQVEGVHDATQGQGEMRYKIHSDQYGEWLQPIIVHNKKTFPLPAFLSTTGTMRLRQNADFFTYFHTVDSIAVSAGGTPVGSVADIQTVFDGNVYTLPEVSATPGFDLRCAFTGIKHIDGIATRIYYDGGALTHTVTLDIWDYVGSAWVSIYVIPTSPTYQYRWVLLPDDSLRKFRDDQGNAVIRIYHSSGGNASHNLYVDFISLVSYHET